MYRPSVGKTTPRDGVLCGGTCPHRRSRIQTRLRDIAEAIGIEQSSAWHDVHAFGAADLICTVQHISYRRGGNLKRRSTRQVTDLS